MNNVIELAHLLIKNHVNSNSICLDLTLGNGNDSLFMAPLVKFIYGFDIQEQAINNSKKLLSSFTNINYILDSHEFVDKYVKENIDAAIYNLGYLPNGNKNITTNYKSTINSIKKVINLLNKNGIIIVVCYEGHKEGKEESIKLKEFLSSLNQKEYNVGVFNFINQVNNPPYLYYINKR